MAETKATLQERLSTLQRELTVPKGQYNAHGGYHYRNAEDILDAVKKLLADSETIRCSDEIVLVGDRYYVRADVCLSNGKESICNTAYAREALERKGMDSSQITGATSSYARKYALNGLFAIDDVKDADSMDNTQKPTGGQTTSTKPLPVSSLTNVEMGEMCLVHGVPFLKKTGKYGEYYSHAEPTEPNGWCNMDMKRPGYPKGYNGVLEVQVEDEVPDPTDEF